MTQDTKTIDAKFIKTVNWIGLYTLIRKEVSRFLSVYSQTIVAPVITTLLFYAVFSIAFGQARGNMMGYEFMLFLTPGLIMMSMAQNAFANTSSSLVIGKVQGNIVDILMAPLSSLELLIGYTIGGVIRGLMLGVASTVAIAVFIDITITYLWAVIVYGILGSVMLALMGVIGGIWSEKFDHMAAVTNFLVTPLTFLSGTFYTMDRLPGVLSTIGQYNPFFFMIDGFRYGYLGQADGDLSLSFWGLIIVNIALTAVAYTMLKKGYKIKN